MSTFRNPVGPQPTNVYWRRRLIVGLGIVAVIVVILLIVFSPKGGTPTAVETTPPAAASSAAPTDTADTPACAKADVTVEALSDKATYAEDQLPQISVKITNTSDAACEINAGSDVQVYTITSGDETIWTSTDCQSDPVAATKVLAAGEDVESAPFEWDRTRSSTDSCDSEDLKQVTAGGASYHVEASVDGIVSAKTRQIILN